MSGRKNGLRRTAAQRWPAAMLAVLGVAAAAFAAVQAAGSAADMPDGHISRRGPEQRRSGGRGLGDRGDGGARDEDGQDRRDRRRRPLRAAAVARRHLRRLGARLRPGRFAQGEALAAARRCRPRRRHRARRARGRPVLPGQLLVLADRAARGERVPRHRARGQRHFTRAQESGGLDRQHEAGLPALPPARQRGDPRGAAPRRLRLRRRRVGPPGPDRPARQPDERFHGSFRARARRADVRRLDRADRRRRAAAAAAAAAGERAQRGRHAVGLGRRQLLHPRRDHDRQAEPHGECARAGLRRVGRATAR